MDAMPQVPYGHNSFVLNPQRRIASGLIVDVSGSMAGHKMDETNNGLGRFARDLSSDPIAVKSCDISVVTLGGLVKVAQTYTTADRLSLPRFQANGDTPMGEAILKSIAMMRDRVAEYQANGIPSFVGWQFLLTDGVWTDDIEPAIKAIHQGEKNNDFVFFCVGVDGADMKQLARLSSCRPPLYLKNIQSFGPMFEWLSKSLKLVSRSKPGQSISLPNTSGWGQIKS